MADSSIGPGWRHSFQARLEKGGICPSWDNVLFVKEDGGTVTFNKSSGQYVAAGGERLELKASTTPPFTITDLETGVVRKFDANGRMTRRESRAGKGITLSYKTTTPVGLLTTVANDSGQTIYFYDSDSDFLVDSIRLGSSASGPVLVSFEYKKNFYTPQDAGSDGTPDGPQCVAPDGGTPDTYQPPDAYQPPKEAGASSTYYTRLWKVSYPNHNLPGSDPDSGYEYDYETSAPNRLLTETLGSRLLTKITYSGKKADTLQYEKDTLTFTYGYTCDSTSSGDVLGTRVYSDKTGRDSCIVVDDYTNMPVMVYGDNSRCGPGPVSFNDKGLPSYTVDGKGIPTYYEYDSSDRVTQKTYGAMGSSTSKKTYYEYPSTCGADTGYKSCYLPTKVLVQGAMAESGLTTCNATTGVGCLVTVIDYDTATWEVTKVTKQGESLDTTGTKSGFCDLFEWKYNSSGQLIEANAPQRAWSTTCPSSQGSPPANGAVYTYSGTTGRLSEVKAYDSTDFPSGLTLATFSAYDSYYGSLSSANIQDVAFTWSTDQFGRVYKKTVGGAEYKTSYVDGRLSGVGYPDGNYEHLKYGATAGTISRLERITRTGTAPTGVPAGTDAIVFDYETTGMLKKQSFYRDPESVLPGTADRDVGLAFDKGRLSKLYLSTTPSQAFREMSYNTDTGLLKDSKVNYSGTESSLTEYTYDTDQSLLKTVTQTVSGTTKKDWVLTRDSLGNITSVKDPNGNRTTLYYYDDLSRVVKVVSPDSGTLLLVYDAAGNLVRRQEGTSVTVDYTYDSLSRLKKEKAGQQEVNYQYDTGCGTCYNLTGRLAHVSDLVGDVEFSYTSRGELDLETRYFFGQTTGVRKVQLDYDYNGNGVMTSLKVTENDDRSWTVKYYPVGEQGQASYDPDRPGKVTFTMAGGSEQTIAEEVKWRSFLSDPLSFKHGNGLTYTRSFNMNGHPTAEKTTFASQDEVTWAYSTDFSGRLTVATASAQTQGNEDQGRRFSTIEYDLLGNLKKATPSVTTPVGERGYTYDYVGNRNKKTYKITREAPSQATFDMEDTYTYADATSGCTTPASPDSATTGILCQVHLFHLTTGTPPVWDNTGGALDTAFTDLVNDIDNMLSGTTEPEDLADRLNLIYQKVREFCNNWAIPRPIFARALLDESDVHQALQKILSAGPNLKKQDILDLVDEIKSVSLSTALTPYVDGMKIVYTYDSTGRLLSEGHKDTTNTRVDLCYMYDSWGRLHSIGLQKNPLNSCSAGSEIPISFYHYDYKGRRLWVRRFESTGSQSLPFFQSYYIYDAADQLIAEGIENDETAADAAPPSTSLVLTRQYVYLAGRPLAHIDLGTGVPLRGCSSIAGPLTLKGITLGLIWLAMMVLLGWRLMKHKEATRLGRTVGMGMILALAVGLPLAVMSCGSHPTPAAIFHYNTDILGTPVMVTDSSKQIAWQARYDEFGGIEKVKRTTRESVTPLRFPGQYDDRDKALVGEEGPYYNLHRYYDPMTGRYTTPDLGLHFSGLINNNLFVYAGNDPFNHIDIDGRDWLSCLLSVSAALGITAGVAALIYSTAGMGLAAEGVAAEIAWALFGTRIAAGAALKAAIKSAIDACMRKDDDDGNTDEYYIENGVRRALSALRAGLSQIPATVYSPGKAPVTTTVNIDKLYSPKTSVSNDARFRSIQPPIHTPIQLQPLGLPGQLPSVPLNQVKIVP